MSDDPTHDWLLDNDPEAAGISAEEYRRRTGIQSLAAETAEIHRHLPAALADVNSHCPACAQRTQVASRAIS